jgi:hypothetical protein
MILENKLFLENNVISLTENHENYAGFVLSYHFRKQFFKAVEILNKRSRDAPSRNRETHVQHLKRRNLPPYGN